MTIHPYYAEYGAIHRHGVHGYLFIIQPGDHAVQVARAMNAEVALVELIGAASTLLNAGGRTTNDPRYDALEAAIINAQDALS
jgi:hypothetical protein